MIIPYHSSALGYAPFYVQYEPSQHLRVGFDYGRREPDANLNIVGSPDHGCIDVSNPAVGNT